MNNDLVIKESWLKRNWKWFLPTTILSLFIFGILITSTTEENITNITQAYSDSSLYEKAIEAANSNKKVLDIIGKIQPIDKLAIIEGTVVYSNQNNSVESSVQIKGSRGNGKIDISADRDGTQWKYKKIIIRTKTQKEEIEVLNTL